MGEVLKNIRSDRAVAGRFVLAIVSCLSLAAGALLAAPGAAEANSRYAAMVVDAKTGRVLFARNPDARRYPASLTKIMTLYMLFECLDEGRCSYRTRLKVSKRASKEPPTKLGLKPGQTIRVRDAIGALVTKSANDVAAVVAENLGGSVEDFARMMTAKAREIGMSRTTFRNASGLPNSQQVTTARDMITLSRRIMTDFPRYYQSFATKSFRYGRRKFRNHNGLLFSYRGTDGIKTGYTRASGFNLTSSVRRGNKHLVAVVMGGKSARSRNAHMRTLLNRSFPKAVARSGPPKPPARPTLLAKAKVKTAPQKRARWAKAEVKAVALSVSPVRVAAAPALPARNPRARRHAAKGRLPSTAPVRPASMQLQEAQGSKSDDGFHVQVGAYASATDAVDRLREVTSKARDVLGGHDALTLPVRSPKRRLYRARFAGFDERTARATCAQLKRREIPCVIMRAN